MKNEIGPDAAQKAADEQYARVAPEPADGYQVGAILQASWGYDQTNIDYFRIIRRTNATVWLQPLQTLHVEDVAFMSETVRPGEPTDEPVIRRKLISWDGKVRGCKFAPSYGWISLWNGREGYATHYA